MKYNVYTFVKVQLKQLDFFVLCLLVTQSVQLMAQSPTTYKLKIGKPDNEKVIFKGYVRDADTIKTGSYKRYKNKVLIESGYYKNNQRDSLWMYFNLSGQLLATGHYYLNEKKGTWDYFDVSGTRIQCYDHSTHQLVYRTPVKNETSSDNITNLTMPVFIGGMDFLNALIQNNVRYPKDAYKAGVSGKCFVKFVVDTTGNTTEAMVDAKSDVRFAKAAVDVVLSLGRSWIPGSIDEKRVPVYYILPVSFRQE